MKRRWLESIFTGCVCSFPDDNNDQRSQDVLAELENIDDECDALGITFVKIDNVDEAKEYGIEEVPSLLYFEKGIPTVYEGRLEDETILLKWLEQQTTSDEIEDITDEMLDLILEKMPYVAVLFCKISFQLYFIPMRQTTTHTTLIPSKIHVFFCFFFISIQKFIFSQFNLGSAGASFFYRNVNNLDFEFSFPFMMYCFSKSRG